MLKLAEARKNGTLERLLRDLRSLDLLILDEWGVPVYKDGSQLLFRMRQIFLRLAKNPF